MATIDRSLNIVIPIDRDNGMKLWIYATPIRREIFETYYLPLSATFSALTRNGLDPRSGPSVAQYLLRDTSKKLERDIGLNWWDGDDGVGGNGGLLAHIVRLVNVLVSSENGWETLSLQTVIDRKMINDEEKAEVMNQLVFFTVSSLVAPRGDRAILINGMALIYGLLATSLSYTDWEASLKTSLTVESTGESPPVS